MTQSLTNKFYTYQGNPVKTLSNILLTISALLVSANSLAVNEWSNPYNVKKIDTLTTGNNAFITLDGFSDPECNNNRIHLTSSDSEHFKEMMSLILSAFHANSKINIFTNSSCEGIRVELSK